MNTEIVEAIPHKPEADSFDFQKSLEIVKQALFCHKILIASTTVLTLILVLIYIITFPSNYQAEVVLIADSTKDPQRQEFYQYWNVFRSNSLGDEGEMMTSNLVIGKVVDKLGLGYADVYHTLLNHLGYLWVESWVGKKYRAIKQWFFPKRVNYSLTPKELERGKTILSFKDGVSLHSIPDTNIGVLTARGPSPRIADIANTMVDTFLEERKIRLLKEAETAYNALKIEVDKASINLKDIERKLQKYYEQNNLLLQFEKDKLQVANWLALKASIVQSEARLADILASIDEINRQLGMEVKDVVSSRVLIKNSSKSLLRAQIVQLEINLENAKIKYKSDSPEIVEIEAQIAALTNLWDKEDEQEQAQTTELISETYQSLRNRKSILLSEMEGLRANLNVQQKSYNETAQKLKSLPDKISEAHQLERERTLLETKYTGLTNKLTIAAVSKATIASAPPAIRVVDYAKYPERPYWPKTKYLILGAIVAGILLGLLSAIMLEFIYGRISRYHLSTSSSHRDIYAIVSRDTEYLAKIYGLSNTKYGRLGKSK